MYNVVILISVFNKNHNRYYYQAIYKNVHINNI